MNRLNRWLNNNHFLLALSFVLAVGIWFGVSVAYSPSTDRTVANVPVEITFPETELNYRAYSESELVAQVEVQGKKYVVERLSAEDISVSARVDTVSASGRMTLSLQARQRSSNGDYTVLSVTPATINVMVDVEREAEFEVGIDCVGASVAELSAENESLLLAPAFTDEQNQTVTVTGPESEVSRIGYVVAVADVNRRLTESQAFTAGLVAYDSRGNILYDASAGYSELSFVTFSYQTAEVMANVNLRRVVPLTCNVTGAPADPPTITLHEITGSETTGDNQVSTVGIQGAVDVISKIEKITLNGSVDFTKIQPDDPMSYRFELQLPAVAGVTYDEYTNISDLYFVAMVDSDDQTARSFDIPADSVRVTGLPEGFRCTISSGLRGVTVVGPRSAVNALSTDDFTVTVDGSAVTAAGAANFTPTITVSGSDRCWVTGSYQVIAEVTARP